MYDWRSCWRVCGILGCWSINCSIGVWKYPSLDYNGFNSSLLVYALLPSGILGQLFWIDLSAWKTTFFGWKVGLG